MPGQLFLKSTPLQDIRENGILGRPLHTIYAQLRIAITERRNESLALLLAEPVMQTDEGCIYWYTFGEECKPFQELPDDLRHEAKAALHEGYLELAALAEEFASSADETDRQVGRALTAALVVPAEENVYWVDGRPVLTLWGCFQSEGDLAAWHNAFYMQENKTAPAAPPPDPTSETPAGSVPPQVPSMAVPASAKFVVIGSRFFWSVFLLALLALLLSFILSRCHKKETSPSYDTSPSPAQVEKLETARQTESELREQISDLRQEIDRQGAECDENNTLTERDINEAEKKAFDERMAAEQAEVGEITVTLKWNNRNDLDLYVQCPNNEAIYYKNPSACNGNLDVDKNYQGELSRSPMENINWQKGKAPPGDYLILVKYYKRQDMDVEPLTRFQVRLRQGDKDSIFDGQLQPDESQAVSSFTVSP